MDNLRITINEENGTAWTALFQGWLTLGRRSCDAGARHVAPLPAMSCYGFEHDTVVQAVPQLLIRAEYSVVFGHSECLAGAGAARCAPTLYFANIN